MGEVDPGQETMRLLTTNADGLEHFDVWFVVRFGEAPAVHCRGLAASVVRELYGAEFEAHVVGCGLDYHKYTTRVGWRYRCEMGS